MTPRFRQMNFSGEISEWRPASIGWTQKNSQRLFLLVGEEDPHPLSFRVLGYDCYAPGRRVVRSARPYIVRYVVGGKGRFNGMPIERGSCYLSVPGQKYSIESDVKEPLVHYWIELSGSKAPLYVERMLGFIQPGVTALSSIERYERVFSELLFDNPADYKMSTYLYSVFFHLLSLHQNETREEDAVPKPMLMYLEAVDYIESHLNCQIKVTDLCDRLHIVPDYLYKIFKRYSGLSTQEYIINSKMHMATNLLASSEYSVSSIADMVGYVDQGQFAKVFRRVHGLTPSEFRRKKLGKQEN